MTIWNTYVKHKTNRGHTGCTKLFDSLLHFHIYADLKKKKLSQINVLFHDLVTLRMIETQYQ